MGMSFLRLVRFLTVVVRRLTRPGPLGLVPFAFVPLCPMAIVRRPSASLHDRKASEQAERMKRRVNVEQRALIAIGTIKITWGRRWWQSRPIRHRTGETSRLAGKGWGHERSRNTSANSSLLWSCPLRPRGGYFDSPVPPGLVIRLRSSRMFALIGFTSARITGPTKTAQTGGLALALTSPRLSHVP